MSSTPTPVSSRFDWHSTAADVVRGLDLHGRRALVTGSAGGIGVETVRALASTGAETIIAARDLPAADRVAAEVRHTTGNERVHAAQLDLLDRASIDALARSIDGPLHILINNAGVMAVQHRTLSPDGHELQLATNHIGHFRLSVALLPALRAAGGARIAVVSSRAHLNSPVVFEDMDFEQRPYDPALAYAQSKTSNVLFAVESGRRWVEDGIIVNALHPGAILDSGLTRHYDPAQLEAIRTSGVYTYKSVEQGAATSTYVATSTDLDGVFGRYFENCQECVVGDPGRAGIDAAGVAAHALDPEAALRLWELTEGG